MQYLAYAPAGRGSLSSLLECLKCPQLQRQIPVPHSLAGKNVYVQSHVAEQHTHTHKHITQAFTPAHFRETHQSCAHALTTEE